MSDGPEKRDCVDRRDLEFRHRLHEDQSGSESSREPAAGSLGQMFDADVVQLVEFPLTDGGEYRLVCVTLNSRSLHFGNSKADRMESSRNRCRC